jgi:NAD+ kinase
MVNALEDRIAILISQPDIVHNRGMTRYNGIVMTSNKINRIGVAFNPQIEEAVALSHTITSELENRGVTIVAHGSIHDHALGEAVQKRTFDLLMVLGGDGTMLRATHLCAGVAMPIIGINLGSFGFLMELQRDEWQEYLDRLCSGDFRLEERMLMQAEHLRKKKILGSWLVVNEVAVCRGQQVKPIRLRAEVNGYPMASYVADGLIASTPTGSTAYALAAGGAILPPDLRNIIIVPVAPHLSPDQSIILSEGTCVTIQVSTTHQAVFSVDGHPPVLMDDGDCVKVSASDLNAHYIRFHDPGYFYRNLNRFLEQNPSLDHFKP